MTFEKVILNLGGNPARLDTGINLLLQNPGSHLVVSSESPAQTVLDKLAGIDPSSYTIDESAWDTVTNFTNTEPLVKKLGATELLVVTDGFHMRRAMLIAELVYFKSGISVSVHPSSPADHQESKRLVIFDTLRAALYRFTNQTLYDQTVYNDRIAIFYNDYYAVRQQSTSYSPK
jgi:uncharacterized SAM-binding protein YcdF (DUF218 family)